MPGQWRSQGAAGGGVPQAYGAVLAACGEERAVGGEGHGADRAGVSDERGSVGAGGGRGTLRVSGGRGTLGLGGERGTLGAGGGHVPEAGPLVLAARQEQASVRGEGEGGHGQGVGAQRAA